jgi:hypothetical protein
MSAERSEARTTTLNNHSDNKRTTILEQNEEKHQQSNNQDNMVRFNGSQAQGRFLLRFSLVVNARKFSLVVNDYKMA